METHDVVIVGAGPVGLIAAMDLAKKGVASVVLEQRSDEQPAHPRCNTTSARTMEILRQIGCNKEYRKCGLDADYPNDVAYLTNVAGKEIARYHLPSANARWQDDRMAFDGGWRSSERPHRASQFYLERILRAHAETFEEIDVRYFQSVIEISHGDNGITLEIEDVRSNEKHSLSTRFLLGCDGSRSTVRRQSGITMDGGFTGIAKMQAVMFRSKDVLPRFEQGGNKPAWMTWTMPATGKNGVLIAIDGEELWLSHQVRFDEQDEITDETIHGQVTDLLGGEIDYEVMNTELWQLNQIVAESYRAGNAFVAGDAAHVWPPWAGHGMNTGIEDAVGLTWLIAAVVKGWAPESILDAYHMERQNVGEKVASTVTGMAATVMGLASNQELMATVESSSEQGEETRTFIRNTLLDNDSAQFNPEGLNFGMHYDRSPLIVYDDGVAPEYEMEKYTPTTVPGCRAPWFPMVDDGSSIYDHLTDGYTLLRTDESIDVSGLVEAASGCGMPFKVIDIGHEPKARRVYDRKLVLVRADTRVAWRSDAAPENPQELIDKVRGVS